MDTLGSSANGIMSRRSRGTAIRAASRFNCEMLESRRLLTGTWSTVATPMPSDYAEQGWVLTDGSILVHGYGNNAAYFKLTPNNGSYVNGTWTTLASSITSRLYFASQILQSGKLFEMGGEYINGSEAEGNKGEIYDPVANTWSSIPNFPQTYGGDAPSELLPNGQILVGYIEGTQTYIFNPNAGATGTWTLTGSKLFNDASDEEAWVTLPDHSILTYDVSASISTGHPSAQRYIPSTGTWSNASGGVLPALSSSSVGYELGPGFLLPDGRVFYAGGTNATAYYTPSTNTWAAGPNMPNGYVMADAPGAELPNGDLLLAMSPQGGLVSGGYNFPGPTYVYEFNPTTNIYTNVTPSSSVLYSGYGSYVYKMLVLPTGQVAMFGSSGTIAIYTPSGSAVAAAVPVITGITYNGTPGSYTLSGTNLNGIDEGAAYGDDNQMSSNYPLVRLTDASGNITYARTTNWSQTGVDQGAETVTFTLPVTDTAGAYRIQSVANGVPSATALAVLVNATTTTNVQVLSSGSLVDVDAGTTILTSFPVSSFSSIYIAGDNSGDTLTVSLSASVGSIITTIQAGSGTDTINVNQTSPTGPVVIAPSAGSDAVNVGTTSAGPAALVEFLAAQQIGLLTIGTGGSATVINSGTKILLQTNGVVTSGTGVLNLMNNDMIVHGGNLATLSAEVGSGFNAPGGGNWNGSGITSSAAAASTTHLMALGIIQNNIAGQPVYSTFDGQSSSITDVLIKYTYFGDANLDGKVDGSDYARIDFGILSQATGWSNGDFDYNSAIDASDYTLLDNAYTTQGGQVSAPASASAAKRNVTASSTFVPPVDNASSVSAELNRHGKHRTSLI
jgi:hypothetical protein